MIRRSDLVFAGLFLGLAVCGAVGLWPREATLSPEPEALTGQVIQTPAAGDWVANLSRRVERRDPPNRHDEPEQDPFAGYVLIGLVETGEAQWALISGNGESQTLELGDGLNGYELVQILADRVVFAQDGDQVVLELRR